jgi:hypothetical protein
MKAITNFVVGGVAIAALASAAPAAAQYYPGYGSQYGADPGYGYPGYGMGNLPGPITNGINGGYGNYGYGNYGYGNNVPGGSQVAASQCTAAVQQRLGYGGYGYGAGYSRGVSVNSVEIRNGGGYRVRGVAAGGYGGAAVEFNCRTDPRGLVVDVDLNDGRYGNGYNGNGYYGSNYADPYSAYGYHRY